MTIFLWACLFGSKMEIQSCLCVIVWCQSMNIVPVCPGKPCLAHNLSQRSQNLTNCPRRALSVLKSDSLSHAHCANMWNLCLDSFVALVLLYTLSWSQTICLIIRQTVPWEPCLAQSQTDCLLIRQSVSCTSCYCGSLCLTETYLNCTRCLEVRQSMSQSGSLSQSWTICLIIRQTVPRDPCLSRSSGRLSHNQTVVLMHILPTCETCVWVLWYFCCLDSFLTLCLKVRQSVS